MHYRHHHNSTELEETLSVPPKATLEQIDLSLKAFVFFCARYYREQIALSVPLRGILNCLSRPTHSQMTSSARASVIWNKLSQCYSHLNSSKSTQIG